MELSQRLLADITQVTRDIEEHYPELQKYLDENPLTLPDGDTKEVEMDNDALREYLDSLRELIRKYKEEKQ